MKFMFTTPKKMKDGFIASFSPLEYTLDVDKAYTTSLNEFGYDSDDLEKAIISVVMKLIPELDTFEICVCMQDDSDTPVGIINICDHMNVAGDGDIDGAMFSAIKQIASDIGMYLWEFKDAFTESRASSKAPVAKTLKDLADADTSEVSRPDPTAVTDDSEIIAEIQKRTKADVIKPVETLDDYMCDDTLMQELLEIKDFCEKEDDYKSKGISIPKGILFKGRPGTGKTYAARCVAGATNCYFIVCTASSLQGMYIGSGAENVRNLFKGAKELRKATKKGVIIFIDELDSFGSRERHSGGASGEEDRTLNQLLAELSGFEDSEGIMVMGATNYPDRIDDALMRAGRFSRQITINPPEDTERLHLVNYYFSKIKMDVDGADYSRISDLMKGLTPADIKEIANESAILAVRNSLPQITIDNINEAVNKVITKNIRTPDGKLDIRLVSAHECGHVLASYIYNGNIPIKVTSYAYGGMGGFTQNSETLDGLFTKERLLNEVREFVAGRAAENVICGVETNGASNDLERAKNILYAYYETYNFESYVEKDLNQLVLDRLNELYEEVKRDFCVPENYDNLLTLTDELTKNRVLYASDIAGTLVKSGGII